MRNGFSFIELLVVMAILGIMATFVIVTLPNSQDKAKDTVAKNDITQYQKSLEQYANLHNGVYPTGGNTIQDICDQLSTQVCDSEAAAKYNYRPINSNTGYYIWVFLETKSASGGDSYFVACSSGVRGEISIEPSGNNCPI